MTLKRWSNLNEIPVFRKYLNIIIVQFRSQQDYTVKTLQTNTKKNFLSQNLNIKDNNCFNIHCNPLLYA
jgi:hypothetical protein